jgi:peroxiredoxin
MSSNSFQVARAAVLLVLFASIAKAGSPDGTQAALQPAQQRKQAPEFSLQDSTGKMVTLKQFQGKVVLLDFWATWCHGCTQEMPWFVEFSKKYSDKGLQVIGVSLDEDGWKAVKPFLQKTNVPYTIVLGNDGMAKTYGIENLPDTFLIDRKGMLAAAYASVVDKANIETNIQAMLSQP